ncbi:MAG: hypothetical protein ACI4O9_03020 [Akkermansia sp.]
MKFASTLFACAGLLACVSPVAPAADSPEQICADLSAALKTEVEILEAVRSPEQADAAVKPLRKSLAQQEKLFQANNAELWEHISNTQGSSQQSLIELLQRLSRQFTRLEDCNFYDCKALREALAPQIVTEG